MHWRQVDWRRVESEVRRLRQRIFTASKAGDLAKGPPVAEVDASVPLQHAGQRAAGDGAQRRSSDGGRGRRGRAHPGGQDARLVDRIQQTGPSRSRPMPVRRCIIPKRGSSTKRRPLGIPGDSRPRATKHGSSTRWNPNGRPGSSRGPTDSGPDRGCHDAIQADLPGSSRARAQNGGGLWTQILARGVRPDRARPHPSTSSERSPRGE